MFINVYTYISSIKEHIYTHIYVCIYIYIVFIYNAYMRLYMCVHPYNDMILEAFHSLTPFDVTSECNKLNISPYFNE